MDVTVTDFFAISDSMKILPEDAADNKMTLFIYLNAPTKYVWTVPFFPFMSTTNQVSSSQF